MFMPFFRPTSATKQHCCIVYCLIVCLIVISPFTSFADSYQYDRHNRLYRIHEGMVHMQFTYDNAGNRIGILSSVDDADFDGLLDVVENDSCTDPLDADTDDDGILDGLEDANQNGFIDEGETNPCDADSDDDGIQDGTELGYGDSSNPDTATTFQPDLDPNTTTNPLSSDSDNDWIPDGDEDVNRNGRVDAGESDPVDQDTTDTDNDGLFDALENRTCTEFDNPDTDGDTLLDGEEDVNHNGIRDFRETFPCNEDSDGDGIRDDLDERPTGTLDAYRSLVPTILLPLMLDDDEQPE